MKINTVITTILFASVVSNFPVIYAGEQGLSDDEWFDAEPMLTEVTRDIKSADELVAMVNAVPEGEHVTRNITMSMTDRHGKVRARKTVSFRKNFPGEERTVLFYLEPANVRDTAFLVWDYSDPKAVDDQWLYIPALRKARRISAADRGDYFLGTDFTYEDMKLDGKLEPLDYDFTLLENERLGGTDSYRLEATPKTEEIAKELGYSRFVVWVDPSNWMILKAEFWDTKQKLLKTLTVADIQQIDGIWTRHKLELLNHQTGHKTEFVMSDVDYEKPVENDWFNKSALGRGV